MNITMTINAETPAELFGAVRESAAMLQTDKPTVPVNPTPAPVAMNAPAMPRASVQSMPVTPAAAPTPMPPVGQMAPVAPIANPMPTAAPPVAAAPTVPMPTAPLAEPPKFTIDEITKAGGDFAQNNADNRGALINLLRQFGVQAVTQLAAEQIGPFATALRGLGAKI